MKNVLIFTVGNYRYGLPVGQVKEIIRIAAFRPLPDQPPFVEGVINLRGEVIPLIDFRRRFLMGTTEKTADKRIIICRIKKFIIGFLVDVVEEVHLFEENQLRDVSNQDLGLDFKFVDKVAIYGDELISILLPETIFSREEIERLISFFNATSTESKSSAALIDFSEDNEVAKEATLDSVTPKTDQKKTPKAATKKTKTAAKTKVTKAKKTPTKRKKTANDKK